MTNDGTPLFREDVPPLREIVLLATYAVMSPVSGLLRLTLGKDPKVRLYGVYVAFAQPDNPILHHLAGDR